MGTSKVGGVLGAAGPEDWSSSESQLVLEDCRFGDVRTRKWSRMGSSSGNMRSVPSS